MKIPLSKKLIVVLGLLSVTASASFYQKPVVQHAEDRAKVGTARVELGYRCEMHNECQS